MTKSHDMKMKGIKRKGVQCKKQTNWSNLTIAEHDIAKKKKEQGACKSHKYNNSPGKVYI